MPARLARSAAAFAAALFVASSAAHAQMRVANWNVTNYTGASSRDTAFQTAIYGTYEGRSMRPDVLIGEEFVSEGAVEHFRTLLNTAPGSPADWAAAPFVDGPDTDTAFFYRTSRVKLLQETVVYNAATGGGVIPRNIMRYDISPLGYATGNAPVLAVYGAHMKSGSAQDDRDRRLAETTRIRQDAQALPAGCFFLLGGDFNVQNSTEADYQQLVGSQSNNLGRFFDPIHSPGTWNNNSAFRFIHTQDPMGAGGMDDRHDQILVCSSLVDGSGFDYVGTPSIPYSTTTWNDPSHSYRAWGNDGTSYNNPLTVAGNTMVGPLIAQALRDSTGNSNPNVTGGHLPVFLDLLVPPQMNLSTTSINFGDVAQGAAATGQFAVTNGVDTGVWPSGVALLRYTPTPPVGYSTAAGPFSLTGGQTRTHTVTLSTSTAGVYDGTLTILSQTPGIANAAIQLHARVLPPTTAVIDRALPDGTLVQIRDAVITASFPDFFYMENTDRASGIRVQKAQHGLGAVRVAVIGALHTSSDGERYVEATDLTPGEGAEVRPLGISGGTARSLPGCIGLLVRAWGRVTGSAGSEITLEDGSGVAVNAALPAGVSVPATGAWVEVTGACSCVKDSAGLRARVLLRSAQDLRVISE